MPTEQSIPISTIQALQGQLDLIRDKLQDGFKVIHTAVCAVNVCDAAARCQAVEVDIDIAEVLRWTVVGPLTTQLSKISRIVEMLGGQTEFTHPNDIETAPL